MCVWYIGRRRRGSSKSNQGLNSRPNKGACGTSDFFFERCNKVLWQRCCRDQRRIRYDCTSAAVSFFDCSAVQTLKANRLLLSDHPDVVVATPSRALALLQAKVILPPASPRKLLLTLFQTLSLSALDTLVIDEADLILSYGHDHDIRQIFSGSYLPKVHQSFLMSATMTEDVEMLKGITLRNPVSLLIAAFQCLCWSQCFKAILKLEEAEDEAASLSQYAVQCSEVDKFLLTYVILKLKLVKGKCILFVNDVDRCYRLKLFLEQFSIKSCVLNSELPLNSRWEVYLFSNISFTF